MRQPGRQLPQRLQASGAYQLTLQHLHFNHPFLHLAPRTLFLFHQQAGHQRHHVVQHQFQNLVSRAGWIGVDHAVMVGVRAEQPKGVGHVQNAHHQRGAKGSAQPEEKGAHDDRDVVQTAKYVV